ncbi:hypothetical protein ACVXHA_15335 [Escherichia coli]
MVLAIAEKCLFDFSNHGIDVRLNALWRIRLSHFTIALKLPINMAQILFMSIHADGFTNPKAAGASVFALSQPWAGSEWRNTCLNAKTAPMKLPVKGD